MSWKKREHIIRALRTIPVGEFTPDDVRMACSMDISNRQIASTLRSIENVRYVRRCQSRDSPSVWEKLYRILHEKYRGNAYERQKNNWHVRREIPAAA